MDAPQGPCRKKGNIIECDWKDKKMYITSNKLLSCKAVHSFHCPHLHNILSHTMVYIENQYCSCNTRSSLAFQA